MPWRSFLPTVQGAVWGRLPPPRASPTSPLGSRLGVASNMLPGLKRGTLLLACSGVSSVGVRCPLSVFGGGAPPSHL